jgi:cytochrome c5
MSRKFGVILSSSLATALLVLAAGTTGAQQIPEGQQILEKRCQGCHDLRPIQISALDADGWTRTIDSMLENGAEIEKDEVPVLVKHLVLNYGPVPDGPGKQILLNTCTMCHDLGRIKSGRRSAEEWEETLSSMLNEGAPLSDAEFPVIHLYLSRHFGVD